MSVWTPVRLWPGATVVVLGGGPSLNDVDHGLWRGRYRSVGINAAYRLGPDVVFVQDAEFFAEDKQGHLPVIRRQYSGLVVTTSPQYRNEPRVKFVERDRQRKHGIVDERGLWPQITNAGHGAICLAHVLGAQRIVLLGFDGRANGNWRDDNPKPASQDMFDNRFRPGIESTAEPLRRCGVDLVNATPGSALCLPTHHPEDVL